MNAWRTAVLLVLLCQSPLAAAAAAPAPASAPQVSMDQAVRMAEQRYHARVVKAEAHKDGTQTVYVLRLLDESGKVWTVHVNAASGAMQ